MTDNQSMVGSVYALPRHAAGNQVTSFRVTTHSWDEPIAQPSIGVVYEIDPTQLVRHGLRIPKMHGPLAGVHNNGFEGREWLADSVPPSAYRIAALVVGPDLLSNAQRVKIDSARPMAVKDAIATVEEIVAGRTERLQSFADALEEAGVVVDGPRGPATNPRSAYKVERILEAHGGGPLKPMLQTIVIGDHVASMDLGPAGGSGP